MDIVVRPFNPSKDVKTLGNIYNQAFNESPDFLPYTPIRINSMIKSRCFPEGGIFLAEIDQKPIGAITAYYNKDRFKERGFIIDWAVTPHYQRKGIGSQLFNYASNVLGKTPLKYIDTYEDIFISNLAQKEYKTLFDSVYSKFGFFKVRTFYKMSFNIEDFNADQLSRRLVIYDDSHKITIKKVERSSQDYKTYFKLENETYKDTFREYIEIYENPEDYLQETEYEKSKVFFAVINRKPIGFVGISANSKINDFHNKKKGNISSLGVLKKYRNNGAGTKLLIHAISTLKDMGMTEVELSVDEQNPSNAMQLYEKIGFKPIIKSILYRKINN